MKLKFIKTIECEEFKMDFYRATIDGKENKKYNWKELRKGSK